MWVFTSASDSNKAPDWRYLTCSWCAPGDCSGSGPVRPAGLARADRDRPTDLRRPRRAVLPGHGPRRPVSRLRRGNTGSGYGAKAFFRIIGPALFAGSRLGGFEPYTCHHASPS